jgi:DNA-binding NarL/FixJ family response regulator
MPDPTPTTETSVPAAAVGVVFTDTVLRRFLFGVVIAMTAVVSGVAAAAFYTSFEAIRSFAARSGGIDPRHAWLAPLLVDSFIFVASAADLWCSATGAARATDGGWQRAVTWLPKALLALAAGGSFALNVAHAPTHLGARVVAALAPAALVLTFEILMMIVRRAVAARVTRLSATAIVSALIHPDRPLTPTTAVPAALTTTSERSARTPPARPRSERSSKRSSKVGGGRRAAAADARVVEVRRLYLDGVTVATEIARRLQIPASTTRRLLSQIKRELAAHPTAHAGSESAVALIGERSPADERSPEPERDGRPSERALAALTRAEVTR